MKRPPVRQQAAGGFCFYDAGLEAINPVVSACTTRHSFWVNKLYQLQPSSQQVRDAYVEAIDCMA